MTLHPHLNFVYIISFSIIQVKAWSLCCSTTAQDICHNSSKSFRDFCTQDCAQCSRPGARRSRLRKPTSGLFPLLCPVLARSELCQQQFLHEFQTLSTSSSGGRNSERVFVAFVLKSSTVPPSRSHLHKCLDPTTTQFSSTAFVLICMSSEINHNN